MSEKIIYIVDVTNRDGVQTSRLGLAKLQKTLVNIYLDEMGVTQSEFGFPTTKHEINYLNANLELVARGAIKRTKLSGWMRALESDVKESFKNVPDLKIVNLSVSTSDQMIRGKFGGRKSRRDIINDTVAAVKTAYKCGAEIVGVNAEDASRTEQEYLVKLGLAVKKAGAKRLRYCDTLGYDSPDVAYARMKDLAVRVGLDLEMHFHNDLGMAVANSIRGAQGAIDGGVNAYVNTAVNGMGERAGNADLACCVLAVLKSSGFAGKYKIDPNIDISKIWQLAKYTSYAFGVPIPINYPAVGGNAFAHESGIHADGALKDRRNYELYDFEELGRGGAEIVETGRMITTGEYGGIKGFRDVYEKLSIEFKDDEEARNILELARYANVHTQFPLVESELKFIYHHPDLAAKIMTVVPFFQPSEDLKKRIKKDCCKTIH
ncbi:MAG: homocitrate synthase [Elusimicrobium sp.]|jgi:homocitrate synthase NifV|nr:homocitrate synthase [Elusimicrobium sp.]